MNGIIVVTRKGSLYQATYTMLTLCAKVGQDDNQNKLGFSMFPIYHMQ